MQQVTIDHVYPEWAQVKLLFPDQQREGIKVLMDAMQGEFKEDATVIWRSDFLLDIETK